MRKSTAWESKCGVSTWTYPDGKTSSISWRVVAFNDDTEIVLNYSSSGEAITERIRLEARSQKFGGVRYFFRCPTCGIRALKLYGLRRFLCRSCQNLTYESCQESGSGVQQMFMQEGFVQIYEQLFNGIKITPYTASKLLAETIQGEKQGKTFRKLQKKLRSLQKGK